MKKILLVILCITSFANVGRLYAQDMDEFDIKAKEDNDLNSKCDCNDLSFDFVTNTGTTTLFNEALIRELMINKLRDQWLDRQENLMKEYLEDHFRKKFENFNEAKNYLLRKNEAIAVDFNTREVVGLLQSSAKTFMNKYQYNLRELHILDIRKSEIEAGNINNSFFEFSEVDGNKIKDIKNIAEINELKSKVTDFLSFNHNQNLQFINSTSKYYIWSSNEDLLNYLVKKQNDKINNLERGWRLNEYQYNIALNIKISGHASNKEWLLTESGGVQGIPNVIKNFVYDNRVSDQSDLYKNCRYVIHSHPKTGPVYATNEQCVVNKNNLLNELKNSVYDIDDAKGDIAIEGLEDRHTSFINSNIMLKREIKEYFKVNNYSKYSHDGINWLLSQYKDNSVFPVNSSLFQSASTPLKQDANNPNRALSIDYSSQAITEGITNFGNVVAELLKDNNNPEFEGSFIRSIFEANGIIIPNGVIDAWLGSYYRLLNNDGKSIQIDFEANIGNYLFNLGISNYLFLNNLKLGESFLFLDHLKLFQKDPIVFSRLWDNFGNIKGTHIIDEDKNDFSNYCAINLSHALLSTGVPLNGFKGATKCWGCNVKKNKGKHVIRAKELAAWLNNNGQEITGLSNPKILTGSNFEAFIDGKKGIVYFEDYWQRSTDSGTNRTGDHIDLWDGNELAGSTWIGTRFRLAFPWIAERFGSSDLRKSKKVIFWEIKN